MQKILFTEFAELRQGDGRGPKYLAGKAYWLTPDQAVRWKAEGVAEDAPEDMAAENEHERGPMPLRPENVRIIKRKNKFHVVGPDGYAPFHDEPLTAQEAEKLRQRILAGEVKIAEAYGGVTVASSETDKTTSSLDKTFSSIERRYVDQVKAQQDYAKVQAQVGPPAVETGPHPEPIEVRIEIADGERKLFIMKPWPAVALVNREMLSDAADGLTVDGDKVNMTFTNGSAVYQRAASQSPDSAAVMLNLVEQTYTPAENPT